MDTDKISGQRCYSVIIPVYNEAAILRELYERLVAVMTSTGNRFQLIFVNDGSTDHSLSLLEAIAAEDDRVTIVILSRNFGQENAIAAGLRQATGCRTVMMDGDLQDPPEVIPDLIAQMDQGYDVVYAVKAKRRESAPIRLLTSCFYLSLRFFSNLYTPPQAGTFSIMDKKVVDALLSIPERNKYISGLRSFVGFKQTGVPYSRDSRSNGRGKSLYSLARMGLNAFFSFSSFPLRLFIFIGAVSVILTIGLMVALPLLMPDRTGMNSLLFQEMILFQFVILLSLVIFIAEYVVRMMDQIKKRPEYLIERIINGRETEEFNG